MTLPMLVLLVAFQNVPLTLAVIAAFAVLPPLLLMGAIVLKDKWRTR